MARLLRAEVFSPDEVAIVHVMARVVRRCFLLGTDSLTGKCHNHRKGWIEAELKLLAADFGIDLLCYAVMSNHFHLVLRSRPDVVENWSDTEVSRRWLRICPMRRGAKEPTESELDSIRNNPVKLKTIRRRLSDISWWMKLICQRIAQRANRQDQETGRFWSGRYRAVRLMDDESILACAAYVDLNPIRASIVETLEQSKFTSAKTRIEALKIAASAERNAINTEQPMDSFLSPVELDPRSKVPQLHANKTVHRASDKGFLNMSTAAYIELLDWTARQIAASQQGSTPESAPAIFQRLSIEPATWCALVGNFGRLFRTTASKSQRVDTSNSPPRQQRPKLPKETNELLPALG